VASSPLSLTVVIIGVPDLRFHSIALLVFLQLRLCNCVLKRGRFKSFGASCMVVQVDKVVLAWILEIKGPNYVGLALPLGVVRVP